MLGWKPHEWRCYEQKGTLIEDILDCYIAYNSTLTFSKENRIQASLNWSLGLIAHLVSQTNAKNPTPYKRDIDDFMFKEKVNLREEAEKLLLGTDD